jgi:hypothetical protein
MTIHLLLGYIGEMADIPYIVDTINARFTKKKNQKYNANYLVLTGRTIKLWQHCSATILNFLYQWMRTSVRKPNKEIVYLIRFLDHDNGP